MSYPPTRYDGDRGQATAIYRRADHAPELSRPSGAAVHYLATGASTGGDFGLYRWDFGPEVSGPDPHFHRTITESFFVLSGNVRLYDGGRWIDASSGDFVHVPAGGVHGFRNESGRRASMLLLFSPGAPREDYFETLFQPGRVAAMSEEERAAFFLRHDNHWV